MQIGNGSPLSIRREWKKAQDHGHHGESSQRTSAVFASWWWWPKFDALVQRTPWRLEPRGSKLTLLNTSYAGYLGVSLVIFAQFTLEMCVAAWNYEKFTKTTYSGVQGRSKSSMLVPPESSSAVLVMISSKSVSICNCSHARRANSVKITIS